MSTRLSLFLFSALLAGTAGAAAVTRLTLYAILQVVSDRS